MKIKKRHRSGTKDWIFGWRSQGFSLNLTENIWIFGHVKCKWGTWFKPHYFQFCSSSLVEMAAPTNSWLFSSLLALGNSRDFFRSVRAISATSSPAVKAETTRYHCYQRRHVSCRSKCKIHNTVPAPPARVRTYVPYKHISASSAGMYCTIKQCCGSGSRIRCLFDHCIRALGWLKNQDPDPGYGMKNPDHISESLKNKFLG